MVLKYIIVFVLGSKMSLHELRPRNNGIDLNVCNNFPHKIDLVGSTYYYKYNLDVCKTLKLAVI